MGWKRALRVGTRRLELFLISGETITPFPYNDPKNFSVGHAAISPDGKTLYFVSDRPGGQGGADIWYSVRGTDGSWGAPSTAAQASILQMMKCSPSSSQTARCLSPAKGMPAWVG